MSAELLDAASAALDLLDRPDVAKAIHGMGVVFVRQRLRAAIKAEEERQAREKGETCPRCQGLWDTCGVCGGKTGIFAYAYDHTRGGTGERKP